MTRLWRTLGVGVLSILSFVAGAATDLPLASDLRSEARAAAQAGLPLVLVYSRPDCGYCEIVKRDYLKPLAQEARYQGRMVVRQINQGSDAVLIGFNGERTTHAQFAAAEKVRLVPVVGFYGPNGGALVPAIVGARLPDFYTGYLQSAIDQSVQALKR
jgi:thioredoxin-related protein